MIYFFIEGFLSLLTTKINTNEMPQQVCVHTHILSLLFYGFEKQKDRSSLTAPVYFLHCI